MQRIEILITANVPEGKDELAYEAIVAAKPHVQAAVAAIEGLGLEVVHSHSRPVTRKIRDDAQ